MAYDDRNTIKINAVPEKYRVENGPVLRGTLVLDIPALEESGWDGGPLEVALWLKEGETAKGPYRFWSGNVKPDTYNKEDRSPQRTSRRATGGGGRASRPAPSQQAELPDDDVPF